MNIDIRPETLADHEAIRPRQPTRLARTGGSAWWMGLREGRLRPAIADRERAGQGRWPYPLQRLADHHRGETILALALAPMRSLPECQIRASARPWCPGPGKHAGNQGQQDCGRRGPPAVLSAFGFSPQLAA